MTLVEKQKIDYIFNCSHTNIHIVLYICSDFFYKYKKPFTEYKLHKYKYLKWCEIGVYTFYNTYFEPHSVKIMKYSQYIS